VPNKLFVAEPDTGKVWVAIGVEEPSIEYVTAVREAPVRLTIIRKKYPKLTAFNTSISRNGTIRAVSTKLCPRLPLVP